MSGKRKPRQGQRGFSLIEVMVTVVILLVGLLGLVGLMLTSQRAQFESYQRVQALVLLQDMVDRINANRYSAPCYALTTEDDGTPYLGTRSDDPVFTCEVGTPEQQARAINDLSEWHQLLRGSAEKIAGAEAGAMVGARGCVQEVSPGLYQVSVVWQGNGETAAPAETLACATGLYGTEAQRRVIAVPVKIPNLS